MGDRSNGTSSKGAKAVVLAELYGRLNLSLVRANAVAILFSRTSSNNRVHLFILLLYLILHVLVLYNTNKVKKKCMYVLLINNT